jgi:hypothetical protein
LLRSLFVRSVADPCLKKRIDQRFPKRTYTKSFKNQTVNQSLMMHVAAERVSGVELRYRSAP